MKTRITAILLLLSLLFCLTACGDKTNPSETNAPVAPATQAPATQAPATEAPETQAPETSAPIATVVPTEGEPTETADAELPSNEYPTQPPEVEASLRGVQSDDAYVNEVLKLRIAKPEGWFFYTDEQIAAANNLTSQLLKDTDMADLMARNGQMIIMALQGPDGSSVNLVLQPKNALLDFYTDEQIFQMSQATVEAQLQSAGMEVQSYESVSMQVGGEERTVLSMELLIMSATVREYQIWFRDGEDYMGVVTLTLVDDSQLQSILDGITTLD